MKEKIEELMRLFPFGMSIAYRENRTIHQTAQHYLEIMQKEGNIEPEEVGQAVWDTMIAEDRIIEVRGYPHSPVGFYEVLHHDLETAVDRMLEIGREAQRDAKDEKADG